MTIIGDFKAIRGRCLEISRHALGEPTKLPATIPLNHRGPCPDCHSTILSAADGRAYCPWCNQIVYTNEVNHAASIATTT